MSDKSERFLRACRRQEVDATPVWIMRQAGRYLKEYRELRARFPFLTLCKTPELAAEVTMLPINILDVDAAILFSDILIPVEAMGTSVEFTEKGPVLGNPVSREDDIKRLRVPDPEIDTPFVMEAIRLLRKQLEGRVPLIGFSGAPFTLASYLVEGGSSPNFMKLKTMLFQKPKAFHSLLEKISTTVTDYLNAQIAAGAQAVQIFDTWAGVLAPRDFDEFALRYTRSVISGLNRSETPVIYFLSGGPALVSQMKKAGSDVIGIDWRIELAAARESLGDDVAIQGNLDPCALFAPIETIEERVIEILGQAAGKPGHIFNLGHGILPKTPVENAIAMVDAVHKYSRTLRHI